MNVYVVSDSPETKQAELNLTLIDLSGKILITKQANISVEPLKGKSYFSLPIAELLNGQDVKNVVLTAELKANQNNFDQRIFFQTVQGNDVFTSRNQNGNHGGRERI